MHLFTQRYKNKMEKKIKAGAYLIVDLFAGSLYNNLKD